MSQKEAQSEPLDDVLRSIQADLASIKKENKGIKGQLAIHRAQLGIPRPGTPAKEPETSPNEAPAVESKPQEAHKMHEIYEWMKDCPNCGGKNPDYKAPTVACAECGVPLSSSEEVKKELQEKKETDKIKPCWNCESEKVKVL